MGRRQKYDIIADILKIAAMGSKKTRLVYLSNLNFTILKEYLEILLKKELLEMSNDEIYTTFKGFFYLEKYEEIQSLLNDKDHDEKIDIKPEIKDITQKSIP
jgi:predicted transcriptional regulator